VTAFLRACAGLDDDAAAVARVVEAAAGVNDWQELPARADRHGLVPLVRHCVRRGNLALPPHVVAQLGALMVRQRDLGAWQVEAIGQIVGAWRAAGIDLIVLKGAVLAHDIYPRADLRPMRDLDVLVAPSDAARTLALLKDPQFSPACPPMPWAVARLQLRRIDTEPSRLRRMM